MLKRPPHGIEKYMRKGRRSVADPQISNIYMKKGRPLSHLQDSREIVNDEEGRPLLPTREIVIYEERRPLLPTRKIVKYGEGRPLLPTHKFIKNKKGRPLSPTHNVIKFEKGRTRYMPPPEIRFI